MELINGAAIIKNIQMNIIKWKIQQIELLKDVNIKMFDDRPFSSSLYLSPWKGGK